MLWSRNALPLAALAAALTLLAAGCMNAAAESTPQGNQATTFVPVSTPITSPPPVSSSVTTGSPVSVQRTPKPLAVELRPTRPEGWGASLIISGKPGATESGPIGPDGAAFVSWAVTNSGSDDASAPFSVDLLVDGVPVERWSAMSGLAAGEMQSVRDWKDLPSRMQMSPGVHDITLVVDATGYLQPLDTPGNSVTVRFEWPDIPGSQPSSAVNPTLRRLPNLTPYLPDNWQDAIRLEGVPQSPDEAVNAVSPWLQIAYKNTGLSSIQRFFLVFVYVDDVLVTKFNQHGLIADEAIVSPPWNGMLDTLRLTPGEHTLTLVLDPTNLIHESDETDNIVSLDFNWGEPQFSLPHPAARLDTTPRLDPYVPSGWSGALVVSSYAGDMSQTSAAYMNSQAYVSWSMRNPSAAPMQGPYTVDLLVSGQVVQSWEREGLAAGAIDVMVDEPISPAFAAGVHYVDLRVRSAGGVEQRIMRAPTFWRDGFAPPVDSGPLEDEELGARLAALERVRAANRVIGNNTGLRRDVIAVADMVYRDLYGTSLAEETLAISILSNQEFNAWVDAECRENAPKLSNGQRAAYLERCAIAHDFLGYYTDWRGVSRIVVKGERPVMDVLNTVAHELGHFRQRLANPTLNWQHDVDVLALREAQGFAHQVMFFRTLERIAGVDLLLYPRLSGYDAYVDVRVRGMVDRVETSEHARGHLLLWVALLSDPELRQQRTVLFNNGAIPAQTAREVFDYLTAFSVAEARIYVPRTLDNLSAQINAIESIIRAKLIPGLLFWNEGSPELREVGLLLP